MEEVRGSHRTRSKAAPAWTVEESLILVNEIKAIESDWGTALPSFQKWQQIVNNCNALDVTRNFNQCKRKWDSLLCEYSRVKNGSAGNGTLHDELFEVIDSFVGGKGKGIDDAEGEEEVNPPMDDDEEEEPAAVDTDPDSDPESQGRVTKCCTETGSKKRSRRMKRQKRGTENLNTWGYFTSPKPKLEESSSINAKAENTNKNIDEIPPEKIPAEIMNEQALSAILQENALQINAILEGNLSDDVDFKLANLENAEAVKIHFARRQGDKIIDFLGKISATLTLLCDSVNKCN